MYLNIVQVCGRLTKAPDLRSLPSGSHIVSLSIATNRTWKDKQTGEKKEEVEFHNATAFGKTADIIAQYFDKGDEIYVMGRLKTNTWKAQDGTNRYRTDVIVEKIGFGQKAKANAGQAHQQNRQERAAEGKPEEFPGEYLAEDEEINVDNIQF